MAEEALPWAARAPTPARMAAMRNMDSAVWNARDSTVGCGMPACPAATAQPNQLSQVTRVFACSIREAHRCAHSAACPSEKDTSCASCAVKTLGLPSEPAYHVLLWTRGQSAAARGRRWAEVAQPSPGKVATEGLWHSAAATLKMTRQGPQHKAEQQHAGTVTGKERGLLAAQQNCAYLLRRRKRRGTAARWGRHPADPVADSAASGYPAPSRPYGGGT